MTKWLLVAMCLAGSLVSSLMGQVVGQDAGEIRPDLSGLQYPALARSARIQGTVGFSVNRGHIELLLGHPMLARAAKENLEKWASAQGEQPLRVDYFFHMDPPQTKITVRQEPIGDAVDRFFLRIFHKPTKRTVEDIDCVYIGQPDPTYRIREGMKGEGIQIIEIDVAGTEACLQTERSLYAALR